MKGVSSLGRPGSHPDDRAIFALALPALAALAADPLYSLADTAFVGRLGTPQLGALAIGSAAFTASFWVFSFLAYGVTPRVARAVGSSDPAAASRTGVQALFLAVVLGTSVTLAGVFLAPQVVRLLGGAGEVYEHAVPYLRIRMLAAVPVLISQVGHGWLRGAQDIRTPMFVAGGGALLNVVLDYTFIYPLGWGVAGAAWATVAGQSIAAVIFLAILRRRMWRPRWRFDAGEARSLMVVGMELAVRTGSLLAAMTFATSAAARMGTVPLAAWQIAMQIFLLLSFTLDSIAIAGQALVGRHLGAGDPERARLVSFRLLGLGLALGIVLLCALLVAPRLLAGIFTRDAEVVTAAAGLLVWLALIQPLSAVAFTLDGILLGASDTRFLAVSMMAASLLYAAGASGAAAFGWGIAGLAAAATLWLLARTLTTGWRFLGGRWQTARV
ncbi:MAG TPA: MATE family efflux transporter [Actinomycetota bacterium]|nr:MATE family efflux transporter [Actinomycetota bacterium]